LTGLSAVDRKRQAPRISPVCSKSLKDILEPRGDPTPHEHMHATFSVCLVSGAKLSVLYPLFKQSLLLKRKYFLGIYIRGKASMLYSIHNKPWHLKSQIVVSS